MPPRIWHFVCMYFLINNYIHKSQKTVTRQLEIIYTNVAAKGSNKGFEKQLFPKYSSWLQKINAKCPSVLKSQKPDFQIYVIFLIFLMSTILCAVHNNFWSLSLRKSIFFTAKKNLVSEGKCRNIKWRIKAIAMAVNSHWSIILKCVYFGPISHFIPSSYNHAFH